MAKNHPSEFDTTSINNSDVEGISLAENVMEAPAVNNAFRGVMSSMAQEYDDYSGVATVGGTADAVTVAAAKPPASLVNGLRFRFVPASDNATTTPTVAYGGLTATTIKKGAIGSATALVAGDIVAGIPADVQYSSSDSAFVLNNPQTVSKPLGAIGGLELSNSTGDATNDITIAAGECTSSDGGATIALSSELTKQLDASWSAGDDAGGLDTGTIADTTYHVFAICKARGEDPDVLFSTSATSPTMPTDYVHSRRIGSIIRASSAILAFTQNGDFFELVDQVQNENNSGPGTSAQTITLTVPTGIEVLAHVSWSYADTSPSTSFYFIRLFSPNQTNAAASSSNFTGIGPNTGARMATSGTIELLTNTSGQIKYRVSDSSGTVTVRINTFAWSDVRGA